MNIGALFSQMVVLFGIILVGFTAAKAGVMNEEINKNLSLLVSTVANPLQVLSSVLSGARPLENVDVLKLTAIAFGMYIVLIFAAKLLPKLFHADGKQAGVYQFLFIFSNMGFLGYPVVESLFGEGCRFYVTIFVLTFQLFCWTYGVSLLSGEKLQLKGKTFLKPMIVSALLAYVIYFCKIPCPKVVYEITKSVGGLTSPIVMLIIGCSLAQLSLKDVFGKWQAYVIAACKLLILPLVGWLIMRQFIHDETMLGVITVMLAMPSATNATIISYQYGGDEKLASAGVFLTTLMSVATLPAMMQLLFRIIPQYIG